MQITQLLGMMKEKNASDLYLKVGLPPSMRVDGAIIRFDTPPISDAEMEGAVKSLLNTHQWDVFCKNWDLDFAYTLPTGERYRINLFKQQGFIGLVSRLIPGSGLSFKGLNLPQVIQDMAELPRGLVIVCGATGSGKSTTLAAMIHHINANFSRHIMTVEDPVEFRHQDLQSIVNQREVGYDTQSFNKALRQVVRQSPDVVLIGEMRDMETMQTALSAAQTGHLVLTTLHTIDVAHTIDRIINYFPDHLQKQIRIELSECLQGVICMRLLRRNSVSGRVPALEIMRSTSSIKKSLLEGEFWRLRELMQNGREIGMQTFNQALLDLYRLKLITFDEALMASSNPEEFKLNSQGMFTGTDSIRLSQNF